MMTDDRPTSEAVDPAIPLESDESVVWTGRPRLSTILPAVVTGLGLVIAGLLGARAAETSLALVLVPIGLAVPLKQYLVNRNTQYVVTDQALYAKRGVLSRTVSQATLRTVQNSSYTQDITGKLFDYGTVTFEIAGGNDLTFRAIDDPQKVRALVDRTIGGDGVADGSPQTTAIPGQLDQWKQIRDEVREVRRTLDRKTE